MFSVPAGRIRSCATAALASTLGALLIACGGGGSDDSYIEWSGSANGSVVKDANNNEVKFLASNRAMEFRGTQYPTVTVDSSARVFQDGQKIGAVALVGGLSNTQIAGLVSNSWTMLAVAATANGISLTETSVAPVIGGSTAGAGGSACSAYPKYVEQCKTVNSGLNQAPCYCAAAYAKKCFGDPTWVNDWNVVKSLASSGSGTYCAQP